MSTLSQEITRIGNAKTSIINTLNTIGEQGYKGLDKTGYATLTAYGLFPSTTTAIDRISKMSESRMFVDRGFKNLIDSLYDIEVKILNDYMVTMLSNGDEGKRETYINQLAETVRKAAKATAEASTSPERYGLFAGQAELRSVIIELVKDYTTYTTFQDLCDGIKNTTVFTNEDVVAIVVIAMMTAFYDRFALKPVHYTKGISLSDMFSAYSGLISSTSKLQGVVKRVSDITDLSYMYVSSPYNGNYYELIDELLTYDACAITDEYILSPDSSSLIDTEGTDEGGDNRFSVMLDSINTNILDSSRNWSITINNTSGTSVTYSDSTLFTKYLNEVYVGVNNIVETLSYSNQIVTGGFRLNIACHICSPLKYTAQLMDITSGYGGNITGISYAISCVLSGKYVSTGTALDTIPSTWVSRLQTMISSASGDAATYLQKLNAMVNITNNSGTALASYSPTYYNNSIGTWTTVSTSDTSTTMTSTETTNFGKVSTLMSNVDTSFGECNSIYRNIATHFNTATGTEWTTSGMIEDYVSYSGGVGTLDSSIETQLSSLLTSLSEI